MTDATKTPAEIAASLSPAQFVAIEHATAQARDREYIGGGRWRAKADSPVVRRVDAGMSTLRAMARKGLCTRPERLGAAGDANAAGHALLTALGLKVRREVLG